MAFKLIARDTIIVPVKGFFPLGDGKKEPFDFKLTCRRMGLDETRARFERHTDGKLTDKDFMVDLVEGWSGVLDDEGQPVPFGTDSLEALLDTSGVASLAVSAYLQEQSAKAKN